ncbi:cell division protein [Photobacterium aquae]|uniref:Cell division protein n=1 Tax=Photobacterium aquae TaxID=1195763 RepID=A0A0J1GVS4_9GAMM|nr:AbrB/MazE/SpoVT family DNA-binding domain-containing protein [Photobacterium aquae]KLV03549.1 cell division protein [Photobacterium aquae]
MRTQIRKIGNSLGNIIPAAFIRQLGLVEGADIEVKATDGKITIEPIKRPKKCFPFSEKELLNGLSPYTAHADELALVSAKELGE